MVVNKDIDIYKKESHFVVISHVDFKFFAVWLSEGVLNKFHLVGICVFVEHLTLDDGNIA